MIRLSVPSFLGIRYFLLYFWLTSAVAMLDLESQTL